MDTITISRASIEQARRDQAEKVDGGQRLYAVIKRSSKYYGQTEKGEMFPVFVEAGHPDAYVVKGGPGGQYRLADVNLYIASGNNALRIN